MLARQIVRQGGEIQSISNKTGLLTLYKSELPIIWFTHTIRYVYVLTIDKMLRLISIDGESHMLEIEIDDIPLSIVEKTASTYIIFYERWAQHLIEKNGELVKGDKVATSELYEIDNARVIEYSAGRRLPRVSTHDTTYSRIEHNSIHVNTTHKFDPSNPVVEYIDQVHIYQDGRTDMSNPNTHQSKCWKYVSERGLVTLILDENDVLTILDCTNGRGNKVIYTDVHDVALHYDDPFCVLAITTDSLKLYNTTGTTLLREFKGNFYLSSITKHSWERNYRSCSNHIKSSRS